jgi:hypothetical protein
VLKRSLVKAGEDRYGAKHVDTPGRNLAHVAFIPCERSKEAGFGLRFRP